VSLSVSATTKAMKRSTSNDTTAGLAAGTISGMNRFGSAAAVGNAATAAIPAAPMSIWRRFRLMVSNFLYRSQIAYGDGAMSRILGGRFLALAQAKKLADNRRNLSSRST